MGFKLPNSKVMFGVQFQTPLFPNPSPIDGLGDSAVWNCTPRMARPTGTQSRMFNYIDPATSKPGARLVF